MYKAVVAVEALPNYHLRLTFMGSEVRIFDFTPYVSWKVFAPLQDKDLFSRVWVAFHTVSWGGGLDFDPQTLYEDSIPIEQYEAQFCVSCKK